MSWYRVPLWDLRQDITSCWNVSVWNLRSCICGAPSLTRGRDCNLQCNHSMVRVAQNPKPYFTVSSETPPAWRARFPYLYPPGTGGPAIAPDTRFIHTYNWDYYKGRRCMWRDVSHIHSHTQSHSASREVGILQVSTTLPHLMSNRTADAVTAHE
jgi:hypothetical protein